MRIVEREIEIPAPVGDDLLAEARRLVEERLGAGAVPVRFAVTASDRRRWRCELGVIEEPDPEHASRVRSIFAFRPRVRAAHDAFVTVFLVPTGIGSEIGGHAGDAMPAALLAAAVSDTLVTHPNVLNASDIMELPPNGLYVEGSVIARMLNGTVALDRVRANRVLAVIDEHQDRLFRDHAVNSVSAARISFGLDAPEVVTLDPRVIVRARYSSSGRAVGEVEALEGLLDLLDRRRGTYDAVALSTQIEVPFRYHTDYYQARGAMVNPWGGPEAIFTHAISSLYDVPTAHAPMLESREVEALQLGLVEPRMAAEVISRAFFICVLKGLQRSPRVVDLANGDGASAASGGRLLSAEGVSCLVIPDGALGLPTLAALQQGIPVIAVRENRNVLHNDLSALPWRAGQLHVVENYWEALGVLVALREGIDPASVRRPYADTLITPVGRGAVVAAGSDGAREA